MKRTRLRPRSARKAATDAVLARARMAVLHRAEGRCEVRGEHCSGWAEHVHHRLMRSAGGGHDLANLVAVCHRCHEWIHLHPAEARRRGWLLRAAVS